MVDADTASNTTKPARKPLKIACTNTDCKNGLHYFGPSGRKKAKSLHAPGKCKDCGADFVDWQRAGSRDASDEQYKLDMFRREWIRHHFWEHYQPSQREVNYARRKGIAGLRSRAEKDLRNKVFRTTGWINDVQTPYKGVVPAAQHATATCCRKCIQYWHGISVSSKPTNAEIAYLCDWIMKYLEIKYPKLTQNGERVPKIRN